MNYLTITPDFDISICLFLYVLENKKKRQEMLHF